MIGAPAIRVFGIPIPLDRRLRLYQPELTSGKWHRCWAVQNGTHQRRRAVPPAVTLVLDDEINLHHHIVRPERIPHHRSVRLRAAPTYPIQSQEWNLTRSNCPKRSTASKGTHPARSPEPSPTDSGAEALLRGCCWWFRRIWWCRLRLRRCSGRFLCRL